VAHSDRCANDEGGFPWGTGGSFMRIAQVAPLTEAVPPKLYGGTERVVHWLTEELVALGHDVTLYASGDSCTSAKLEAPWPRALRLDDSVRDPNALHMMMLEQVRQRVHEYDFLHFHLDYYPFSLFARQSTPFVTTLHGRLDLPEHQPVFKTFSSAPVISISNAQRRPLQHARWVRTIHHGLPEMLLTPQPVTPSYFAFLGRIAPEKGVDRAIRIAQRCGVPLKLAAKVDRVDREYFEEKIEPMIDGKHIEYIGEITDKEKSAFLSGAIALLVPIDWPEPFGLVMIEAMACGTPVIAFNRGSVPEVIDDGVTGFIVEDEPGAIGAVDRLSQLPRDAIRKRFEERFTARRMAQDYLAVYRHLMEESPAPRLRLVVDDERPPLQLTAAEGG
jgi:glycosyltransferase involved in cell wall biosynthesis